MSLENISLIVLFGFLSLLTNGYAWIQGFYRVPLEKEALKVNVVYVFTIFAIFIFCTLFLPIVFHKQMQVASLVGAACLLFFYCHAFHKNLSKEIWKRSTSPHSIVHDFGVGAMSWLLAFPLVTCIGQICDTIVTYFFGEQPYEQLAVQFLKDSLHSPVTFVFALFTILIAAPVFEEFLFRGVLQNWFKKHLGVKAAIPLTSFFFALFHFSPAQEFGNFSLTLSLFILGSFLGFLYERERSLFASIGLHSTFNAISTLRIILFPES